MSLEFMKRAIELSQEAVSSGKGQPFGAVIVKDGKIIGEGHNEQIANYDVTAHGEVQAIRSTCAKLKTPRLEGCELYTSCEPCPMCYAAMLYCGITKMYYGTTIEAIKPFFTCQQIVDDIGKPITGRSIPAEQLMDDEATRVVTAYGQQKAW